MRADYAQAYRELYRTHWWWRAREEYLVETLRDRLRQRKDNRILDVGCGAGLFFERLAEFGQAFGVEVDVSMKTGDPLVDDRIFWGPIEEFHPAERFSAVLLLDVLEHLADPLPTLRRAVSMLDEGGILVATVPAFQVLWTRHDEVNEHVRRYTKQSFRRVLEAGNCRVEVLRYFFLWTFPAKLAVRAVQRLIPTTDSSNGLPEVPPLPINRVLYSLSRLEQRCLGGWAPVGSSLLGVSTRAGN